MMAQKRISDNVESRRHTAEYVHPTTARPFDAAPRLSEPDPRENDEATRSGWTRCWPKPKRRLVFADALYRAVQRLRDLAELEPEEAVFLFDEIYQCPASPLCSTVIRKTSERVRPMRSARGKTKDDDALTEWLFDRVIGESRRSAPRFIVHGES